MMNLMKRLPKADLPQNQPLVLASASPRRAELLRSAGYEFTIDPASDDAECEIGDHRDANGFVKKNAFLKAQDVARRYDNAIVIGADTVAVCDDQILGKPRDVDHAQAMLTMLRGRTHHVLSGICVWLVKPDRQVVDVVETELEMLAISDAMLAQHLASNRWAGKAGGFGFQDGNDWLKVTDGGSESNIVGLPMERLAEILEKFGRSVDCIQ